MDQDEYGVSLADRLLSSGSQQEFLLKAEAFGTDFDQQTVTSLSRGLSEHADFVRAMTRLMEAGAFDKAVSEPAYSIDFFLAGAPSESRPYMRFGILEEYSDAKPYLDYDWKANPSREARERAEEKFAEDMKAFFAAVVRRIEAVRGTGIPSVESFKRRNGL